MSTFADSFTQLRDESLDSFDSVPHQDEDGNAYDPSQQFDSFVSNDDVFGPDFGGPDGSLLPEEGVALREWRRENAVRLEEKEKREKELLTQIIEEGDHYKVEFYKKREVNCEDNKVTNREREKIFVADHEKFHAEADKHYWKAIAEFIPNKMPTIEKRGKKDKETKPSIVVVQGPKPGKPTDLSRMRQILLKLKNETPLHLKHSPPAPEKVQDSKSGNISVRAAAPVTGNAEAVVAA
ncbi:hypothetical protein V6N13_034234 [Hibiscus sabdariffa]|uniref:Clathrin light chain n=1 Tax=Hibiscus sabdariffa TaxID=183260 RepID=A0ABR2F843_9ROSI